jgi:polyisoprenoid-binding protein YceI
MGRRLTHLSIAGAALVIITSLAAHPLGSAGAPLAIDTARVTIDGTSNIHAYTASTTKVRVTRAQVAAAVPGTDFWDGLLKPGAVAAFDIAIPAATLTSPKEGLDKNMYKALKVQDHADITFRLVRFEAKENAPGETRAIGMLQIAGVEREVTLNITTKRTGSTMTVHGRVDLLMTDYGITPPKAMLGMLKTDPKVTVTFETVLTIPLT